MQERIDKSKEEITDVLIVSEKEYPIEAALVINEAHLFIISAAPQTPFAVLIKNQEIVRTFESLHDMVWDRYKK